MGWPSSYRDFDVAVTRRGGLLEVRVLDSPAGETGAVLAPLVVAGDLGSGDERAGGGHATRNVGPAVPTAGDDAATGAALFGALLHGDVLTRCGSSSPCPRPPA